MSLLKKLLGLESSTEKPSSAQKPLTNRAHRVQVSPMHNLKFIPRDPPLASEISVSNVSLTGLGLFMKNLKTRPSIGQKLSGNLSVEGVETPIVLEAKQLLSDVVGCLILNPDNDLKNFIKNYFEVELEVFVLKPQNPKIENGVETNHLKGSSYVQLWWRNALPQAGPILEYRISFFGSYVEGGTTLKHRYGSWTSGKQEDLDQKPENIWAHVQWEKFFPELEKEKLLKIITYSPELTPEEKKFLKSELGKF